jgi:hypothetical protein
MFFQVRSLQGLKATSMCAGDGFSIIVTEKPRTDDLARELASEIRHDELRRAQVEK